MEGLMTEQLPQPGVREKKNILEILVWILSGNSHADQPAERRLGGGNRAGDSYVAKSCLMKIKDAASIAAVTSCLQDGIGDARQVAGNPLPQLVGKCDAASIAAVISCLNRMVQKTEKFCADRVQKKKLQNRVPEVIQ